MKRFSNRFRPPDTKQTVSGTMAAACLPQPAPAEPTGVERVAAGHAHAERCASGSARPRTRGSALSGREKSEEKRSQGEMRA